ncbi:protein pleiotropic regulatory locus 1 [Nymphaea colorata]|nr:protein pleiotropic regulatory locus 1 [Nymphaea colorata]
MPGPATMAATSSSTAVVEPVEPQSLKKLSLKSLKRALDVFASTHSQPVPPDPRSKQIRINYKVDALYGAVKNLPTKPTEEQGNTTLQDQGAPSSNSIAVPALKDGGDSQKGQTAIVVAPQQQKGPNDAGLSVKGAGGNLVPMSGSTDRYQTSAAIIERLPSKWPRPVWHAPWKNYRVISGHLGWVRSIAFDPSNEWFCTGSADRTIKIWSVATGKLKLTLTGHIEQIRGLAVSVRHPYMFSAGDDKQVKCWDLEQNKVIRSYHGHLSGVYCLALHPTLDILLTGGRDSVCRVWDVRTKAQIFALSGHENTVCSVFTQAVDPQVVTGSHDTTVKFWDLAAGGKTMLTLTHHKKSVRAIVKNPSDNTFASASADNIKKFMLPRGEFLHNMLSQQKTIINSMAVNEDGVMATAGDNGSLWFWDWKSGHNFQQSQTIVQPGSLDSEAGIYALSYDVTGSRLVSCEADKTIKMWKQDEMATPETHPVNFKPPKEFRRF